MPPSPSATSSVVNLADVLKSLQTSLYDKAKKWAGAVIILQLFLFVTGIVAIFVPSLTLSYPPVALPIALAVTFVSVRAGKLRTLAEALKREHEHLDGFGKLPSGPRLASLRMDFPDALKPEFDNLLREGITYASDKPHGPVRALENLSESSWYSQHLAGFCYVLLGSMFFGTLALTVWLLLICATTLTGSTAGVAGAKCVAATLLFLISVGLFRHWSGYCSFSKRAERSDADARRMLEGSEPSLCEAHRLLTEYQVARASAPLVPTWVWRIRKGNLNKNWALHIARN